jgi:hypothetical protein
MSVLLGNEKLSVLELEGFVAIPDLVPLSEVDEIRRILCSLHDRNVGYEEGAQFDSISPEDGDQPRRFPQLLHPRNFAPSLMKTEFFKRANLMAREILGENARFKADISLMKPAHIGAATPWHQDEAFLDPRFDYQEVSFWLALQLTDQSNSCLEFIPGSHNWPVLTHGYPNGDSRVHALECADNFDASKAVSCALSAGGCTIHRSRTLHFAGPNRSDRPRLAYVLIFDLVPTLRTTWREFPWRQGHRTARDVREQIWRRRGGLFVHLWRQRSRARFKSASHLLYDLGKAAIALTRL